MVAIYCRISGNKPDNKDVSIEAQEAAGIEFANGLGLPYKVLIDRGISGAKSEIEDRPAFADLISDIRKKNISVIYANSQSRIARSSKIWPIFVYEVEKADCTYYENGKFIDFSDYLTRFATSVVALADELYSNMTREKVRVANRINARKGKGHGITAYGYTKDINGYLIIDTDEAITIENIFKWSLEGIGSYTIANKLNKLGTPPKSKKFKGKFIERKDSYTKRITKYARDKVKWRGNTVYDMITNPIYKGERNYGDVTIQIEPIIKPDFWDKVNKNLIANKKNVGPNTKFKYLLNGLLSCAECGADYRGKFKASGRNKTYICKGSSQGKECNSKRGLNIPRFESFVLNHLFQSDGLRKKLSDLKVDSDKAEVLRKEIKDLRDKKRVIETSKKHYYTLLTDPRFEDDVKEDYLKVKEAFEVIKDKIEVKVEKLSQLSEIQRKARLDKIFGEFDYHMNFNEIKKSVHGLVESIYVKHLPEQKNFIVQIKYRGFDKKSVFGSDHNQMKWINMSHYQVVSRTPEDKKDDEDLIDYFASTDGYTKENLIDGLKHINAWDESYKDWDYPLLLNKIKENSHGEESVINIVTPNIELKKEELYDFNTSS